MDRPDRILQENAAGRKDGRRGLSAGIIEGVRLFSKQRRPSPPFVPIRRQKRECSRTRMKPNPIQIDAGKNLVCPRCFELLTFEDIEGFHRCPYCDYAFTYDEELEDFLMRPVIREWVRRTRELMDSEERF